MDDPSGFALLAIIGVAAVVVAVLVGHGPGRVPSPRKPEDAQANAELAAEYDRNRTSAQEMADRMNIDPRG